MVKIWIILTHKGWNTGHNRLTLLHCLDILNIQLPHSGIGFNEVYYFNSKLSLWMLWSMTSLDGLRVLSWVDTEPSHPFYKQEMILLSYVGENWVLKLNSLSLQ